MESNYHTTKAFPSVLPVLLIEAISLEGKVYPSPSQVSLTRTISACLDKDGWAWLVCGRKLFVWRYIQTTKTKIESYELELPGSDLLHKADLIRLVHLTGSVSSHAPGVIAVSPEGIIRYWPNVAHLTHTIEACVNELQGQEFFLLIDIAPHRFILGTTTSTLSHISILNNSITCHTLKVPQGMLAGLGRKVTSIFGFNASTSSNENRSLVKIIKNSRLTKDIEIYILANSFLQLWAIIDSYTEKLIVEHDLTRITTDAFQTNYYQRKENIIPSQIKLWFIDMIEVQDQLLILVAALNQDNRDRLVYGIMVIDQSSVSNSSISLKSFTALSNHSSYYSISQEQNLRCIKMLPSSSIENLIYVYDKSKILCVDYFNDVIDTITFSNPESVILGAGMLENSLLALTSKDNLIQVIPKETLSTIMESENSPQLDASQNMQGDASTDTLKYGFRLYRRNDKREATALMANFLASFEQGLVESTLDEIVLAVSKELCDESPTADPRWAESNASKPNYAVILALLADQLQEKIKIHLMFIDFLRATKIWQHLTLVTYGGITCSTRYILLQHTEKIVLAIIIKKLQNDVPEILEPAIKNVAKSRGGNLEPHMTELDIFYQQSTSIQEIFTVLIQMESDELVCIENPSNRASLVIAVSQILVTAFTEVRRFRQSHPTLYLSSSIVGCEQVPLTATTGPGGMRQVLLDQLKLLVNYGAFTESKSKMQEDDIQQRGAVYQKIMDISDFIFEGYKIHLQSIDPSSPRYHAVLKSFHADRNFCIEKLFKAEQYERLFTLAEKYEDFDTLIGLCDKLDDNTRLDRYIEEYKDKNFTQHLCEWYMKEKKQGKLLATKLQDLSVFLRDRPDLNWIHHIGMDNFTEAGKSLQVVADQEREDMTRKKLALSISKLCFLSGYGNESELNQVTQQLKDLDYLASVSFGMHQGSSVLIE